MFRFSISKLILWSKGKIHEEYTKELLNVKKTFSLETTKEAFKRHSNKSFREDVLGMFQTENLIDVAVSVCFIVFKLNEICSFPSECLIYVRFSSPL